MKDKFSVLNKTGGKVPGLPLLAMKNDILGKNYSLSLAFLKKNKMKEINKIYRKKNKPTNILSFPLTKTSGEIIICPSVVKSETKKFNKTFRQLSGFLVIHGMLHLKGMTHGAKMEKAENKCLSRTKFLNK